MLPFDLDHIIKTGPDLALGPWQPSAEGFGPQILATGSVVAAVLLLASRVKPGVKTLFKVTFYSALALVAYKSWQSLGDALPPARERLWWQEARHRLIRLPHFLSAVKRGAL